MDIAFVQLSTWELFHKYSFFEKKLTLIMLNHYTFILESKGGDGKLSRQGSTDSKKTLSRQNSDETKKSVSRQNSGDSRKSLSRQNSDESKKTISRQNSDEGKKLSPRESGNEEGRDITEEKNYADREIKLDYLATQPESVMAEMFGQDMESNEAEGKSNFDTADIEKDDVQESESDIDMSRLSLAASEDGARIGDSVDTMPKIDELSSNVDFVGGKDGKIDVDTMDIDSSEEKYASIDVDPSNINPLDDKGVSEDVDPIEIDPSDDKCVSKDVDPILSGSEESSRQCAEEEEGITDNSTQCVSRQDDIDREDTVEEDKLEECPHIQEVERDRGNVGEGTEVSEEAGGSGDCGQAGNVDSKDDDEGTAV